MRRWPRTLAYTPVSVRYNSGLHTSENGRELAARLEELIAHWPVAVDELTVLAHSMGGLLIRSAVHYRRPGGHDLAGPPEEHRVSRHTAPRRPPGKGRKLGRYRCWAALPSRRHSVGLVQLRSAGITDLRFGHLLDEDWQGRDRFEHTSDTRQIVPLPEDVACYTVAATTASRRGFLADRLIGDGLVPVSSALGEHHDPDRDLGFPESSRCIHYGMNHLGLLSSPEVSRQIVQWLTPATA